MRRWLEERGYMLVYKLALSELPGARWLHDVWARFWYRHYCPHPIQDNLTARACIDAGTCGCSNLPRRMED